MRFGRIDLKSAPVRMQDTFGWKVSGQLSCSPSCWSYIGTAVLPRAHGYRFVIHTAGHQPVHVHIAGPG